MRYKQIFLIINLLVIINPHYSLSVSQIKKNNGYSNELRLNQVEPPHFSIAHGFYTSNFDLVISSATPGAIIKYTLDCSDPLTNSSAYQQTSPVTIKINPESTEGNRPRGPAVIVRACAIAAGLETSKSVTNTYLFINKISSLSPEGQKPAAAWPAATSSANPQAIDYGMDPEVYNDSRYKGVMESAFLSIPSISIATDLKHIFSLSTGIYMNAMSDGIDWERPTSVELLNPDMSEGFQINCGIRIRGGWSRHGDDPKHAFRLFFRNEYGKGKLEYPLFENEGVSKFDKIDLRTSQNYAWSYPGHLGQYNVMNRDVFSRDLQREIGQPYTRSRYYHLYLDGVYWGLYQSQERAEASFAESYMGGVSDDYDVIQPDDSYRIEATAGNLNGYNEVWNLTSLGFTTNENYFKLQGKNIDGTSNSSYKNLVDIDNLIDYMLIIFFTGNFDSPTSKFGGDSSPNNFFAVYNRNANDGFKFFAHDAEHTLRTTSGEGPGVGLMEDRVNIKMSVYNISGFHPQWLHYRLSSNAEYRIRFADHVYKHMFNQGAMTPTKAASLFQSRAKEIELAIIAESARWGDTYAAPPRTKDKDWLPAINDIVNNYFPVRTGIVLNQLKTANLYPNISAPIFFSGTQEIQSNAMQIQPGYILKIQKSPNESGTIFYTIDGQDPRVIGGTVSTSAKNGGSGVNVTINSSTVIKARLLNGSTWSALHGLKLNTNFSIKDLKVTEIHYHPLDQDSADNNEYEFLEMKNIGQSAIDLSQANFIDGITYSFPNGAVINPNQFIVLASNRKNFGARYGFQPFGEYAGQLDNGGERITLVTTAKDTIFSVKYDDQLPWPETADGLGYSLVTKEINPAGDLNNPASWRASISIHGSPGKDDVVTSIESGTYNIPNEFNLSQNFPNPFNPETTIRFQISAVSRVNLKIYDLLGREIATLVDEVKQPGAYNSQFTILNSQLPSGVYFYTLKAGSFAQTKKMLFLK